MKLVKYTVVHDINVDMDAPLHAMTTLDLLHSKYLSNIVNYYRSAIACNTSHNHFVTNIYY